MNKFNKPDIFDNLFDNVSSEIDKSTKGQSKADYKSTKGRPEVDQKSTNSRLKKDSKSAKSRPKVDQKSTKCRLVVDQKINLNDCWLISDRAAIILGILIFKIYKIFTRKELKTKTKIKLKTIIHCLKILKEKNFIIKSKRIGNNGSIYLLNQDKCDEFIKERWSYIIDKYGNPPIFRKNRKKNKK